MKSQNIENSLLTSTQGVPGADPGGVRWVRTNPPSSLQYQLFLKAELILGCKLTQNSQSPLAGQRADRRALRRA